MQRRGFLSSLTAFAATAALDPERLLWRPGAKTIFVPPLKESLFWPEGALKVGDIISFGDHWSLYRVVVSAESRLVLKTLPPFEPPELFFAPIPLPRF